MKKTLKKTLSIILTILMIVSTVPFAFAAGDGTPLTIDLSEVTSSSIDIGNGYDYYDEDGYIITGTNTNVKIFIYDSCDIIFNDMSAKGVDLRSDTEENVTVTLDGDNYMYGLFNVYKSHLTINGDDDDTLNIVSNQYAFGTGGNAGTLTVNGGKITAVTETTSNFPTINCYGGFTLNGGEFTASNNYSYVILNKTIINGGTLNVISTAADTAAVEGQITMKKGTLLTFNVESEMLMYDSYLGYIGKIVMADDVAENESLFVRYDTESEFVPVYDIKAVLDGKTYAEIKIDTHEHSLDNTGKCVCGYECPHESITDGKCDDCGAEGTIVTIEMTDSCGDGWTGNEIIIEQLVDGTYTEVATATIEDGKSGSFTAILQKEGIYALSWLAGDYPDECGFTVSVDGEAVYGCADGSTLANGEVFYTKCEHTSYTDGKCVVCGYECPHESITDGKCDDCGAEGTFVTIEMTDSYGDGWTGNEIIIEQLVDGTYTEVATATIEDGKSGSFTANLQKEGIYAFSWVIGSYASDCSFTIAVNGETVYECADGSTLTDGQVLYVTCEHTSYTDGKCDVCGNECTHENYTDGKCDGCGYECPHEGQNGSCQVCGVNLGKLVIDLSEVTSSSISIGSGYTYYDEDGYIITGTNTNVRIFIYDSCDIIFNDMSAKDVSLSSDTEENVTVTLDGDNYMYGLFSVYKSHLTINGDDDDTLNIVSNESAFGTGGNAGTLTVNGGKINAVTETTSYFSTINCAGGFTLNGGEVTASNNYSYVISNKTIINGGTLNVISTAADNEAIDDKITVKKGALFTASSECGILSDWYDTDIVMADDVAENESLFVRYDTESEFVPVYDIKAVLDGKTYAEIKIDTHEHSLDNTGKCVCGYECPHESITDGKCDDCGAECTFVTIEMTDSYGDGWTGNAIQVGTLSGGVFTKIADATVNRGTTATYEAVLSNESAYAFKWTKVIFAEECSFSILIDGETVFEASTSDCNSYANGDLIYVWCNHNFTDGKCDDCGYECLHENYTDGKCDDCGYEFEADEPTPDTTTIYFDNTSTKWSRVNAYFFDDSYQSEYNYWPGTQMTEVEDNIYSIQVPKGALYVVFNNGATQTDDLTIPTDGANCYDGSGWKIYSDSAETAFKPSLNAQTNADGSQIRFVTCVDSLRYKEVGFVITNANNKEQTVIKTSKTVYTSIIAGGKTLTAADITGDEDMKYILTYTVTGLDKAPDSAFEVTSFVVNLDGTTIYGETKTFTVADMLG